MASRRQHAARRKRPIRPVAARPPVIRVKRLPHGEGLPLPTRMSAHASGFDLAAAVGSDTVLRPGERTAIPTGFCFEIPPGYEVQVRPRSGLALKHGITVLNAPGTVDADYRGEVKVILANLGAEPFTIRRSDRIAQAVPAAVPLTASFVESDQISATGRGAGGFGSSGT